MLNKTVLADQIGVKLHTIVRWENRQSEPSIENLAALSRVLCFPTEFFFGEDLEEPINSLTSFRSQKSMSAGTRDAALAAGAIGFRILDWVNERFDLPAVNLPDLRHFEPEEAASSLRQEWALGEAPISDMIQLLESKGVRVFSLVENTKKVNAYSLRRSDATPCVFLNTFKSAECSRFDAAHELAHLVLHQDGSVTGRIAEDQANAFASAFLMPKPDILAVIPRVVSLGQLIQAKSRWKVSLAALAYRLHKLNIITDWKYRDFCIEMTRKGFNKKEPESVPREKSIIWDKVLKSLWAERITQHDIARYIDCPNSEVSDLLFGVLNNGDPTRPIPPRSPILVPLESPVASRLTA